MSKHVKPWQIQIQDVLQTSKVERRRSDPAGEWPKEVLLVGWGARPRFPDWWKKGNPVEAVTCSTAPATFHNLADLMRMRVEEMKPLGQDTDSCLLCQHALIVS